MTAAKGSLQRARRRADQAEYQAARLSVIERSQNACEARVASDCSGLGNQAHHIRRRAQGGTHDIVNLMWICSPCHTHVHANPEESYNLGFLARSVAS